MKAGYRFLRFKHRVENLLMLPFILAGKLVARLEKTQEYKTYYLFPFFHIGGAEKIHYQLAQATAGPDDIIYFTRRSVHNGYYDQFVAAGCVIRDISPYTDNKWIFFVNLYYRGLIAGRINRQKKRPLVFNGQCNFAYKISPWLHSNIVQVELIHALNTFTWIRIPFVCYYRRSITVSAAIIEKHKKAYAAYRLPALLTDRFGYIMSRVKLPTRFVQKDYDALPFRVLYAGRSTPEKRPWIVAGIARELSNRQLNIKVEFAGEVEAVIPAELRPWCHFHGDIADPDILYSLYEKAHVLVIPSSTESGPLVFMEAMAKGAAIVSTSVGYIPEHVQEGIAGFVVSEELPEDELVARMAERIIWLYEDRQLLQSMGRHNVDYAYRNFDISLFNEEYRALFESLEI